jgi:succinyl-diaminopimelate desuccinylase
MNHSNEVLKERLVEAIGERQGELVELLRNVIQIPSDNPPGDTVALTDYLEGYFSLRGIESRIYEPREGNTNLVATLGSGEPHLVLNGHLDQFPAEVGEKWTHPPYSGLVDEGKIYGRGSGDMKGGLASLVWCFALVKELAPNLPGKLTLTLFSDEESGGQWGAGWVLDNVEGVLGDGVLNGEPSGLTVRIGEKGMCPLLLRASGKPAHGSFAGYAGDNAIMKVVRVLPIVEAFGKIVVEMSEEETALVEEVMRGYDVQFGHEAQGLSQVLRRITVNIGTIKGGSKANIVPGDCEAEVDARVPLGITQNELKDRIEKAVRETGEGVAVEYSRHPSTIIPATYSPQEARITQTLTRNAEMITGEKPLLSFTSGGTDCRYFRIKGVPSVAYGPRVTAMGAADEHITVEDLVTVAKVQMGTIVDFLTG